MSPTRMNEPHNINQAKDKLITQCQQILNENLTRFTADLLVDIGHSLDNDIETATNNQEHMDALGQATLFNQNKKAVNETFQEELINGFALSKTNQLNTQIKKEDNPQTDTWSLVDDGVLEEVIGITGFAKEIANEFQEKLWQLEQRLSYINDGIEIDDSNNPLSPVQFFVSLKQSLSPVGLATKAKLSCYKALTNTLHLQYSTILNKANALLISEGILPDIRYEKKLSKTQGAPQTTNQAISESEENQPTEAAASPAETVSNRQATQTTGSNRQGSLVGSIRNLLKRARQFGDDNSTVPVAQQCVGAPQQNQPSGASPATPQASGHGSQMQQPVPASTPGAESAIPVPQEPVVFSEVQIVEAVGSVQHSAATAHFFSEQSQDVILSEPTNISENSARVYQELYNASPDGSINAQHMYTIDMVGMLFEYILSDENLPDSVKTLLSHLHTPFLKLAFMDNTFFEDEEHTSRVLLNELADAGANWIDHDGTSQYDMYNEIKRVVQRIVKEFKNDVGLFAELLAEFNALKKRVTHMHNLRERNSIEKKQGQEKHDQAKALAREEIKNRVEGRRVPSSIISLLSPWFTYLTFTQLKEGSEGDSWKKALDVIDNLIIYSSIKAVKNDTQKLEEGFNKILKEVEKGLDIIAYNQTKAASILQELLELKQNVLEKKVIKTTVTSTRQDKDSVKPIKEEKPNQEEERVMNYIKLIEPGTWVEYDKQRRLKVNGFNAEAGKYVLIDQSSQEVTMLSRLEFARDILAETANILDGNAKPLFERALQTIRLNLDKQVQASPAA